MRYSCIGRNVLSLLLQASSIATVRVELTTSGLAESKHKQWKRRGIHVMGQWVSCDVMLS